MANTTAAVSGIYEDCPTEALDSGGYRTDTNISVYFVEDGDQANAVSGEITSDGWSTYEENRVMAALASIENYIDVSFTETADDDADFQLVLDDGDEFENSFFLGYFYMPTSAGDNSAVMGAFNGDGYGWNTDGGLDEGGVGYATILHELLHGLGLAHPHDGDTILEGLEDSTTDADYPFGFYGDYDLNQQVYTVMSYNDGWYEEPASENSGNVATPMALDIAILQELYGANTTYNSGDNTYELGETWWEGIWDTGGTDTISYSGNRDATIDLREATLQYAEGGGGFISAAEGIAGGFTIANGAIIENAVGGSGDDTLIGNEQSNELTGNAGSDDIAGERGADTLSLGSGNDTGDGDSGADTVNGNGGTDTIYGSSGFDDLNGGTGVDTIFGGSGDDTISGGANSDFLYGGRGDDTIEGGDGSDELIGGFGADVLTGDGGADDFIFEYISDSFAGAGNRDTITDFTVGTDNIDLSNIDGLSFVGTAAFSNTAGELRLDEDGTDTIVQVDSDGDGSADLEIVVSGVVTGLTESDFIL